MKRFAILLCSALACTLAWAENSTLVNGYTIHHNALTTDSLSPAVASAYRIQRSKGRGLVNISIMKNQKDRMGTPVSAKVMLSSRNLIGYFFDSRTCQISHYDHLEIFLTRAFVAGFFHPATISRKFSFFPFQNIFIMRI